MQQEFNDHAYMAEALRLAKKGLYTTRSNPRVGCVIVKDKKIIGKGYHVARGQDHAEVNAINNCVENTENATVYVSLEPCTHYGNTPPCIDALLAAKVSRVVIAMKDPHSLVNGNGISKLKESGIDVCVGILESDAFELNKGFVYRVTKNKPYVTVKAAISMDGRTALSSGESKWISGEAARLDVQKLRARSCVILTGIETVLNDDPSLNVRLSKEELSLTKDIEQPIRAVVDTKLRLPKTANILNKTGKVVVYTCCNEKNMQLNYNNSNLEFVLTSQYEDYVALDDVMSNLAEMEINEVLVEAGPTLVGKLLEGKIVDEMILYIAPHLMGNTSRGLANLSTVLNMQDRVELDLLESIVIGSDLKINVKPKYN